MKIKALVLAVLFLLSTACASIAPTPMLVNPMTELNNEVVQLYLDCSEEANYVPTTDGCDPTLLKLRVDELLDLSEGFISADIKQPHGYDIHLATALIYFRISQGTLNDYSEKERIARQFFEIQMAGSGKSLDAARYWLVHFTTANASKQMFEDRQALTPERKEDLTLAFEEGVALLERVEGPRRVRLSQALELLRIVISSIP